VKQPTEKVYIDINEAAELLCMSKWTIYGLVRESKIPYYKPYKKLLFKRQELIDSVEAKRYMTAKEFVKAIR